MQKTVWLVLVEQLGSVLYLAVWFLLTQHLYCQLLGKPEQSWLRQGWKWLRLQQHRAELRKFKVWTLEDSAKEPEPGA